MPDYVKMSWHEDARTIVRNHRLLMLVGEPGVGKTWFAKRLAMEETGRPAMVLRGTPKTDLIHLWGGRVLGDKMQTDFADGPLPRSLKHDDWLVVEELNLIPLETRGYLLDLRGEDSITNPITGEVIPISPRWRLVATANPDSVACHRHSGVAAALIDDFIVIDVADLSPELLQQMLADNFPTAPRKLVRETIEAWNSFREVGDSDDAGGDRTAKLNFRSASHYLKLRLTGMSPAAATRFALVNKHIIDPDRHTAARVQAGLSCRRHGCHQRLHSI